MNLLRQVFYFGWKRRVLQEKTEMMHPTSRVSSCLLLNRGGEKEVLPESRQAFQVIVTGILD